MANFPSQLNPIKFQKYIFRLPLFTRGVLVLVILFWILELQSAWDVPAWGALVPEKVSLTTMYRLNTYPLIHVGFIHFLLNTLSLIPLLERFEAGHGTLLTAAYFGGPFSTLPGAGYLLVERGIFRANTPVMGASVWIFVLLGAEAVKAYKANPHFAIGSNRIPTWCTPLILLVFVSALIPNTSFLGHLCSVAVGYAYGFGYLKLLAPPEKILRWLEGKLNLLGRLPHYVSLDQKTYGRYGVLPTSNAPSSIPNGRGATAYTGSSQRLGP